MMSGNVLWIAAAVLLSIAVVVLRLLGRGSITCPYAKRPFLVSPAERSFFGILEQAVGTEYRIFAKVRVLDVLQPRSGLGPSSGQSAINRVSAKHFDFVLCAPNDLAIVGAVELDDASHQHRARQARDAFLVAACEAAGLPLVRVRAQRTYSVAEVRRAVTETLTQLPRVTTQGQRA